MYLGFGVVLIGCLWFIDSSLKNGRDWTHGTIDVRRTEAAAQSDEVLLIRPGSDAALALTVMHVIVTEKLYDAEFVGAHTIGFEELSTHVLLFTPAWGAAETGLEASQIISFARDDG
jgi:anaerobic selenocysteine-containing dehydrogenase